MWLKLESESGSRFKITWGNDHGPYPINYLIGAASLKSAAKAVSERLDALTEWSRSSDYKQLPGLLRELATAGASLQYELLWPQNGAQAADVSDLKEWLERQYAHGDTLLSITADPDLHVPWGLVFDGETETIPQESASIADFKRFWSLKYQFSTVFSGYEPAQMERPRDSFRILSVVNRNEYDAALSDLDEGVRREFEEFLAQPVGIAYNVERCEQLVAQAAAKDTIFHFFGHNHDGKLDLGNEQIDIVKFKMLMDALTNIRGHRRISSCSVIFINACESIIGELDYSLRSASSRPGLCGLIGTEAMVPRDFAIRFGAAFLKSLAIDGRSIGETMNALRKDERFWPISLLYACYAYPQYRIRRSNDGQEARNDTAPDAIT